MQSNESVATKIAEYLLQIHAIKLQPTNPFTWASGWKSPIYSDNRLLLSHVKVRNFVKKELSNLVTEKFNNVDAIVGVATAGIAPGTLVADYLNLPFGYVRSEPKKHGMAKQIEGDIKPGTNIVVIEDLVSTGKSSLAAIDAIKDSGCNVLGLACIFTYDFNLAKNNFDAINCPYFYLSNYPTLINVALHKGYVNESDIEVLSAWRNNPSNWTI